MAPRNAIKVTKLSRTEEPSVRESGRTLRVGCFNIAHGRGGLRNGDNRNAESREARLARLEEIAELIRAENLDIVALNECDFDCSWSQGVNQARVIAGKAGFGCVAEPVAMPWMSCSRADTLSVFGAGRHPPTRSPFPRTGRIGPSIGYSRRNPAGSADCESSRRDCRITCWSRRKSIAAVSPNKE